MKRRAAVGIGMLAAVAAIAVASTSPGSPASTEAASARSASAIQPGTSFVPGRSARQTAEWCGTPSAEDRPPVVSGKAVHVVYAYPADAPDRFAEVVNRINGDIELIARWWQSQDQSRTIRFDLAAFPCGPQVDITSVRLPDAGSVYHPLATRFARLSAAMPRVGLTAPWARYLVYVDGPVEENVCGQGGGLPDGGPYFAFTYLLGPCSELETVAIHEILHSLGIVRAATGATHGCPGDPGHVCDSPNDMMYPFAGELFTRVLDFNRDDYYGHSGAWHDLQDSPWMRRAAQARLAVSIVGGGAVKSEDPGIACPATNCEADWDLGLPVRLSAEPADGNRLVRWEGACTGSDICTVPMDQPAAVVAHFAPESYPLTVVVKGKGTIVNQALQISCAKRCRYAPTSLTALRLTARPAKGWRLRSWSGGCSHKRLACSLPMSGPTTAQATFVRR